MSLRKNFKTDPKLERNGVELDYGDAVITVARAGGSNRPYRQALAKGVRPYRAAIDAETIEDETLLPIMIRTFVDHVVLDWKTRRSDKTLVPGIEGVEGPDGELLPYTKDNAYAFLLEVPELYRQMQTAAAGTKYFLEDLETAAKN